MNSLMTALILVVLLSHSYAGAEMYRWEDENGVVTFKDTPPPPSKKHGKVKIYGEDDFAAAPGPSTRKTAEERKVSAPVGVKPEKQKMARFNGSIEMYVTSWCRYCLAAEKYMKNKNYEYVKYDIEKDAAVKKRYRELGGKGVPFVVVGANRMSGFSPETLERYMGHR